MSVLAVRARLAALVALQVIAVAVLHGLGHDLSVDWGDAAGWLAATPPADAAVTALRYAGLVAGWWLLGGTGAYLLARGARLSRATAAATRVTLPSVRRVVDRAVATGATASLLLAGSGPALAEPVIPPAARTPPVLEAELPTSAPEAVVPPPLSAPAAAAEQSPAPARAEPRTRRAVGTAAAGPVHVVTAGEHLWGIAAATVAAADGHDPAGLSAADIGPYWVRLVAANRDRLRSGDPDLVYPGERVVLPPLR